MIAKLKGILDSHRDDGVVIDVGGVGYLIFGSSRTLGQRGGPGAAVSVHVEAHVRELHIHLYGFATESERRCFQVLQTVQGVGAKAALAVSICDGWIRLLPSKPKAAPWAHSVARPSRLSMLL